MSRERDFYRKMEEDARNSMYEPEIIDVSPPDNKIKTNYFSAVVWTVVLSAMVCGIYTGFLLFLFNESGLERTLEKAATHAISNLENKIELQNEEIKRLKAENKRIYDHIKFWAPIEHRLPPGIKEKWDIPGYGVPRYEYQSYQISLGETLCLPSLE